MVKTVTSAFALLIFTSAVSAQEVQTVWRCSNPAKPPRFATSEEFKNQPPPCTAWLQLRGPNLLKIVATLADDEFELANVFLADAAELSGVQYPVAFGDSPVSTAELFRSPQAYGFITTPADDAPAGSLVLYDGLGGILVEARASESEPWEKKVLYPSAQLGFRLTTGDLFIPGKSAPKVLIVGRERDR